MEKRVKDMTIIKESESQIEIISNAASKMVVDTL